MEYYMIVIGLAVLADRLFWGDWIWEWALNGFKSRDR